MSDTRPSGLTWTIPGTLRRHPRAFTPLCATLLTTQLSAVLVGASDVFSSVLTTIFLLASLLALKASRGLRAAAAVGIVVIALVRWTSIIAPAPSNDAKILAAVLIALYSALLASHVLAAVLREQHLSLDAVSGAVATYLLVAHAFALCYFALELGSRGSIDGIDLKADGGEAVEGWPLSSFLYFSFVTLTTLGYGDISPASPVARALVMLEATSGQFFFAIFVARLVGVVRGVERSRC